MKDFIKIFYITTNRSAGYIGKGKGKADKLRDVIDTT